MAGCGALAWDAAYIGSALKRKRIHGRDELAMQPGFAKSSVYRSFGSNWSGTATTVMMSALSCLLRVSVGRLVKDPWR